MRTFVRSFSVVVLGMASCIAAHTDPALFEASFIMHAVGNDTTTGASFPFNSHVFRALPRGWGCSRETPDTFNGAPMPGYCGPTTIQRGKPATGVGELYASPAVAAPVALPQSAFGITTIGLFWPYYPYLQSLTYATFVNAAGSFRTGGGPGAGKGTLIHSRKGHEQGSWIIREGSNGFGGAMGLLGRFSLKDKYVVSGKVGTYVGTMSRNMIAALGRSQYATPIGVTAMGETTAWRNPYVTTGVFTNNVNGNVQSIYARGTGTPWTTGSATVYATAGLFTTILHRQGFDATTMIVTPVGTNTIRNLQLVSPALTHWISPGSQDHTGHIGILTLQIIPEPTALLLLAAGIGALHLVRRARHRRGRL